MLYCRVVFFNLEMDCILFRIFILMFYKIFFTYEDIYCVFERNFYNVKLVIGMNYIEL